jgi:hypothetical protein
MDWQIPIADYQLAHASVIITETAVTSSTTVMVCAADASVTFSIEHKTRAGRSGQQLESTALGTYHCLKTGQAPFGSLNAQSQITVLFRTQEDECLSI